LTVGVESDQLVFDYLSRVGDLAQTALPAAQRMQLVAQLRSNIDRERGGSGSAATVRRILGRIGTPDEVVEAAAGAASAGGRTAARPEPVEPQPGSYGPYAKPSGRSGQTGSGAPKPRRSPDREEDAEPEDGAADAAPRRRSRPSRDDDAPDWWSFRPSGGGRLRAGDELAGLPGMTGEIFIPFDDEELAEKDPPPRLRRPAEEERAEKEPVDAAEPEQPPAAPRRLLPRIPGTRRAGGKGWGSPVLLLAAALLIAGAAIGSWIPLGLGWLAGYLTRTLSRPQAKFAVLGIPGLAALGLLVWLWGRDAGRWGTPIAQGQLDQAILDGLPATIRLAAVGSALYLLWRARRMA
jgi:hypothetical protein